MSDKVVGDAEYWVMRLWRKFVDGRYYSVCIDDMTPSAQVATIALLETGKLATLPDGCIAEPVEVFDDEDSAHRHREVLTRKHPHEVFRVVMNIDVTV